MKRSSIVTAVLLIGGLGGCATVPPPERLTPEGAAVRVGTAAPRGARDVGLVEGADGSRGCGALRPEGTLEQAYIRLKNQAAALGADYVQVLTIIRPHFDGQCVTREYRVSGMAYRVREPRPTPVWR